jgi:hypothetical protein
LALNVSVTVCTSIIRNFLVTKIYFNTYYINPWWWRWDHLCCLVATDPEIRVRFPAVQYFLRSSGPGMGSTQPREYNWGATWKKK